MFCDLNISRHDNGGSPEGNFRFGTRTSSLGAARPLPLSADIGPGGQSVGQAAQFCLAEHSLNRAIDQPDARCGEKVPMAAPRAPTAG